jgi:Ca2+-binding EF-hand superfamily protein
MSCEKVISFEQAVAILRKELNYPEQRALHFVKMFDHNHDGQLSVSEFNQFKKKIEETKKQLESTFARFDRDGNGYVTLEEASVVLQKEPFRLPSDKVKALLERFDKDKNGKLDYHEFAGFFAEAKASNEEVSSRFDQLDKDRNGFLSADEVTDVLQQLLGFDKSMAGSLIALFDTNKDGQLDKTEFLQMWREMFGH